MMTWFKHVLRWVFTSRPCPMKDIKWENQWMPDGDYVHDVYQGQCRVCGSVHTGALEFGVYRRGYDDPLGS